MSCYRVSHDATADIADIRNYISLDNEEAAERVVREFFGAFAKLAMTPGMGRAMPDLADGDLQATND